MGQMRGKYLHWAVTGELIFEVIPLRIIEILMVISYSC